MLLAIPAYAQDARIQSEIERLRQAIPANFQPAEIKSATEDLLKAAGVAQARGDLYLTLEKLGQAEDYLQGARASLGKVEAFDTDWSAASRALAASDRELRAVNWSGAPAALRALSETAQVKAVPLLDGARGFATATGPKDGMFYVGQALGEIEFARFCATLRLGNGKRAFPLRSFLPELDALQKKTNAAFQPPKSIDMHPRFIALNSAIKLAKEADAAKSYAGALYQYLEAVRHYAMLDTPPVPESQHVALKASLAAARKKLESTRDDESIALLFVQRAQSQIAHDDGSASIPDEWRVAQVVLNIVLPAHAAARKSAGRLSGKEPRTVELTLVRWPYT